MAADYYKLLGVKRTASVREIKSAYRNLARVKHPDANPHDAPTASEHATQEFAAITHAYRTLINPHERARYDAQRENLAWNNNDSVLGSNNPHARRLRRAAAQRRWDRAIDRWIENERKESRARTQAVFTTVSLFLSTFIVAVFKPRIWDSADDTGRLIVVTLFVIGIWHLASRLRDSLRRYTYAGSEHRDSIIDAKDERPKPFARSTAFAFLIFGSLMSFGLGLLASHYVYSTLLIDMASFFDNHVRPDLLIYPPIAVLLVDTMHTVASKIDPY